MDPKEDKIFLCVWLLVKIFLSISDWRCEDIDAWISINGFNVVLEKFSFDLKHRVQRRCVCR